MPDSRGSFSGADREGTDERARQQRKAREQYADDLYQRASMIRKSGQNPSIIRTRRLGRMRRISETIASLTGWVASVCASGIIAVTLCCIIERRTIMSCIHKTVGIAVPAILLWLIYLWYRSRKNRYESAAGYAVNIMMDLRDYRGFKNFDDDKLNDVLKLVPDIIRDISASNAGTIYFDMVIRDEIKTKYNEDLRELAILILQGDLQRRPEHMDQVLAKYGNDTIYKKLLHM